MRKSRIFQFPFSWYYLKEAENIHINPLPTPWPFLEQALNENTAESQNFNMLHTYPSHIRYV